MENEREFFKTLWAIFAFCLSKYPGLCAADVTCLLLLNSNVQRGAKGKTHIGRDCFVQPILSSHVRIKYLLTRKSVSHVRKLKKLFVHQWFSYAISGVME